MENNEYGPDLVSNEKLLKENEDLLEEIENYQPEVDKYDAMMKVRVYRLYSQFSWLFRNFNLIFFLFLTFLI